MGGRRFKPGVFVMTITLQPRALFGFAVGLAIAAIAFFAFQSMTADAVTEGESTFVAITPCRLFDTRPGGVGLRSTPLGTAETHPFQVTGTNGDCTIPAAATAVSINLTGVGPTADTNLRVFPVGAAVPNASAVNMQVGQGPTPNKLDVKLSNDGKLAVYNRFGAIDVIGDVMGYYRADGLSDLETRVAALETSNAALVSDVAALQASNTVLASDVAGLQTKLASVSNVTVDGQPTVRFTGVNVQIVDGSGETAGVVNGRGNLIVGYNESAGDTRTGSHNIVTGTLNSYIAYGGIVSGNDNSIEDAHAAAIAGTANTASGLQSAVLGGSDNTASGIVATVGGGNGNVASGQASTVSGGDINVASGFASAVSAGLDNAASASWSAVSAGVRGSATAAAATVSGGSDNTSDTGSGTVSGGSGRVLSGLGGDGFDWSGGALFQSF